MDERWWWKGSTRWLRPRGSISTSITCHESEHFAPAAPAGMQSQRCLRECSTGTADGAVWKRPSHPADAEPWGGCGSILVPRRAEHLLVVSEAVGVRSLHQCGSVDRWDTDHAAVFSQRRCLPLGVD